MLLKKNPKAKKNQPKKEKVHASSFKLLQKISLVFFLIFLSSLCGKQIFAHSPGAVEVLMYKNRYEPKNLEIKVGETIDFVNISGEDRWPASDIHPTHQIYSEFDPKSPIKDKQHWEFTFNKPGTWQYHDHLNPKITGEIIVVGEESGKNFIKDLRHSLNIFTSNLKLRMLSSYYSLFPSAKSKRLAKLDVFAIAQDKEKLSTEMKIFSPETIMKKLLDQSGNGGLVDCHREAHYIGRSAYDIYGAKVFGFFGPECHSGFYHGAMESFLISSGGEDITQKVAKICNSFETKFGLFECYHGVGHGIMAYKNYDLPAALELCESLQDDFSRSSCSGGVFMENVVAGQGNAALDGHTTNWLSESDMHFPCNTLEKPHQIINCYMMQTSWILYQNGYDFRFASDECGKAPQNYRFFCYQSLGRDIAGITYRSAEKSVQLCENAPEEYYFACISGAVQVVIEFWGPKIDKQAFDFCNALKETDMKNSCKSLVASKLPSLFPEKQRALALCDKDSSFREECTQIVKNTI